MVNPKRYYQISAKQSEGSPTSYDFCSRTKLHLGLLPVPFIGNLATASVLILQLNLHAKESDYAEANDPAFIGSLQQSLTQTFAPENKFPFMWLNPAFKEHSGYEWWFKRLKGVISKVASLRFGQKGNTESSLLEAQAFVAQNIAHLELVPYRSPNFGRQSILLELPSVQAARSYVGDVLIRKAQQDQCLVIVTRSWDKWRVLRLLPNVVRAKSGRSVWFPVTAGADVGCRIVDRLCRG
jgi:hypothetical protein